MSPQLKDLNQHVVPMPAFTDPNLPEAAGGSINYGSPNFPDLEDHPVEHSPDFGGGLRAVESDEDDVNANRDEWSYHDWAARAKKLEIPSGGKKDELIARVTAYEAELQAAKGETDDSTDDN